MSPTGPSGEVRNLSARLWHDHGISGSNAAPESCVFITSAPLPPATRPLLWTGLRAVPARLAWRDAPPSVAGYELRIVSGGELRAVRSQSRSFVWPADLPLLSGETIAWEIECLDHPDRSVRGSFWILAPEKLESLGRAERLLAQIEELDVRALAQALAYAEYGLYDDAIALLDCVHDLAVSRGRSALACRAQISVLIDMQDKLPPDVNQHLRYWISLRLRQQMSALGALIPRGRLNNAMLGRSRAAVCLPQPAQLAA